MAVKTMRRAVCIALLACCLTLAGLAEALPAIGDFSPGMRRVTQAVGEGDPLWLTAQLTPKEALHIREMTVLSEILSGMTMETVTGRAGDETRTKLTLRRGGEDLLTAQLEEDESGTRLALGGETLLLQSPVWGAASLVPEGLARGGWDRFARLPLEAFEAALTAETPQTFFGLTLSDAQCARTMSDDGERFTRLDVSGSLTQPDGAVWRFEGFLRRPGGKAPKDTAELTFTWDADNALTLAYSAANSEKQPKGKTVSGEVAAETRLKVSGKLGGSQVSLTLTVKQKNAWAQAGDALTERIAVTTRLDWQDATPGRALLRLNKGTLTLKESILAASRGDATDGWTDDADIEFELDGSTVFSGRLALSASLNAAMPEAIAGDATPTDGEALLSLVRREAERLAIRIYGQLSPKAKETIRKGL